jgi:hypothetical protein
LKGKLPPAIAMDLLKYMDRNSMTSFEAEMHGRGLRDSGWRPDWGVDKVKWAGGFRVSYTGYDL